MTTKKTKPVESVNAAVSAFLVESMRDITVKLSELFDAQQATRKIAEELVARYGLTKEFGALLSSLSQCRSTGEELVDVVTRCLDPLTEAKSAGDLETFFEGEIQMPLAIESKIAESEDCRDILVKRVLRDISVVSVLSFSQDELFAIVHRLVQQILPAKNFYISRLDAKNARILFPYCKGETGSLKRQRRIARGLTEYLLRQNRMVYLGPTDLARLVVEGEVAADMAPPGMHWLGAPLIDTEGKSVGAMVLFWFYENILQHQNDCAVLEIIATQVSAAIERLRCEEAFKESEERFTRGPAAKLIIDPRDGRIVVGNEVAAAFYGYSAAELKKLNISDINIAPAAENDQIMAQANRGGEACAFRHRMKNGLIKDVEVYFGRVKLGGESLIHSTIIDVSERKKAEQALKISAERLSIALQAHGSGIWDRDLVTGEFFVDSQWKTLHDYEEDDFANAYLEWQNRVHPEDKKNIQRYFFEALKGGNDKFEMEYRVRHRNGGYRWLRSVTKILRDETYNPVRMIGIDVDITDKKRLMDFHLEHENRLKDFAQAVMDISFVIDEGGRFVEVFGADATLFPLPKERILGHTLFEVFSGQTATNLIADIRRSIDRNSMLRVEYVVDIAQRQLYLVGRINPMNFVHEGKKLVAAVFQDFTERWKVESLLQASYQMRRKSDFLNDFILGNRSMDKDAMEFAAKIGLDFSCRLFCCIVMCEQPTGSDQSKQKNIFDKPARKDEIMAVIGDETNRVVWDCRDGIGIIYQATETTRDDKRQHIKTAKILQGIIGEGNPGVDVMIGIGDAGLGINDLRKSFQQAWSATQAIRSCAGKLGNVSHYRDLGILQLLAGEIDTERAKDFVGSTIGKIIDYDREKKTKYLQTLEVILAHDSLRESAQLLFLHPNTVLFRRRRIEKMLNISLDDMEAKVALIAAVKLHKLNG